MDSHFLSTFLLVRSMQVAAVDLPVRLQWQGRWIKDVFGKNGMLCDSLNVWPAHKDFTDVLPAWYTCSAPLVRANRTHGLACQNHIASP